MKGARLELQQRNITFLSTTCSLPFLVISLRRKKRGVDINNRFIFPFSPVSCPCPTSFLFLMSLSPQMCGWTRDYCFNVFLIYIFKSRDFIPGLCNETKAKHKTRGPWCHSKTMVLSSSHVAGPQQPPGACAGFKRVSSVLLGLVSCQAPDWPLQPLSQPALCVGQ